MKKLLLLLFFALMGSFIYGQYVDESFEGATWPPTDWLIVNNGSGNDWIQNTSSSNSNTGNNSAEYHYNGSNAADTWLFTKAVTLNNGETVNWEFYEKVASSSYPENLKFTVGTAQTVASQTTTLIDLPGLTNTSFVKQSGTYTAPADGTYYFALNCYSDADQYNLFVDDVLIEAPPACPDPSDQTESNITNSSADLGWTENGSATTWEIEYGTTGFAQGSGTTVSVTANPYTLSGLSANTEYDWYVRADCGGGDYSGWVGPSTFYTGYCLSTSTSSSTYTDDFTTTGGSTNISNTSSGYATDGYENATAMSVSSYATGTFDFSAAFVGTTVGFNIWVDWNNDLDFDDAGEKVYASGGYVSNASGTITIPGGTANGNYRMRTRCDYYSSDPNPCGERTRAETEDYTLTVVDPPSCPDPSAQTESNITKFSADLGWTENGSATTWEIEYGTTGFAQGSGTTVSVTANPYNLSGLSAGTTYDWYVRADCGASGGSGQSSWVGPHTFSTMDDGYTCDFPLVINSLPYNTSDNTSNYGDDYDNGDSPCNNYYLSGDDVVYSYTPAVDECVDITLSNLDDTYSGIHVLDGCPIDAATCVAFEGNSTTDDRVLSGVNLTAGTTYYIVISTWATPQSVGYTLDIDNCPTCTDPTNQAESNITSTSADLSWTENSGNTAWEIEYGLTGYAQGSGTTIAVTANPYTLSGLTASTDYDWYVRSDCGGGTYSNWVGPHNFTTLGTPPANDDCDGAYVVTVNSDLNCGNTTSGTVENATQSPEDASACGGTEDDDVWFKFVATATSHKIELLNAAGSTTDLYHSVWEGTCPGGLTLVPGTCSDPNSQTVSGLTVGNTYFIRVYTWTSTGGQNTTFDVCVGTPPPPPANDDCDGAYMVTVNNDLNCGTTTSGTVENATQSPEDASACSGTEDDDVWFKFVATATEHKIELLNAAGSTTDLYHSVWEGTCPGGLTLVPGTCSDPNSQTVSGLTVGNTYFIRVYTYTSTGGQNTTFDVCVGTPPPPPANDDCSGAIALTVGNPGDCPTNQVTTDATSATADGNTSCDNTGDNIGVWYSFVAPASGEVVVNYTAGTATGNPGIVLFDACGGTEIPNTCQDNPATLSNITGLTGGTTYYMLLWFDGASAAGSFDICLEDVGSCPKPTAQTETNITATSADLGWTENGSATIWDIEWGASGFTQGSGTTVSGVTANPYTLSGLTAGTDYDWYVRADCGGGSQSLWEGPHTFKTSPVNDVCSGAIALTVGTSCTMATYTNENASDSGESPAPGCGNYNGADVWFSFVVPALGHVIIDSDVGDITDGAMAAYSGTCGALSLIECDDDDSANGSMPMLELTGLTAGETVYIRFWEYGGNVFGTFDICVYEGPCTTPTGLSASNETTSGADLSWTENGGADHWDLYIVTAGSPAPDASTTPTVDDTPDNPYTWTGGAAATDYDWYVRADCGASGGTGQSDWSVKGTFTTASADAVDWCNLQWPDQATITAGGSVDVYAQVYEPGVTDAAGQGAGITAWIGYSTTDTDPSTWTDWVAATYNVDSGNNDEYQAALGAGLAPGTYYYASRFKLNSGAYQYGGYSSGGGGFWDGTTYVSGVLTVNHVTGDVLCDAIALTVDAAPATYSNSNCTGEANEPNGSCWNGTTTMESIWFSFVAPNTGSVEVTTDFDTPLNDTHIAIYEVGDCSDMATLTEKGCDEDSGDAGQYGWNSIAQVYGLTAGNTYYVQVDGYNDKDGEFQIQVKEICPDNLVVLPASSSSTTSTGSCVDGEWTHYYNGTNILLSLKLGSSGAVITDVTVDPDGATDAFWGDNDTDGFPEVSGAPGGAFMRRKWDVNASTQPSSDVGIRFYYTTDEYDAVNTEIINHGGTPLSSTSELNFYKVLSSSTEQDPFNVEPGGLGIGDIKLIEHSTNPGITEWVDGTFGTENYAEYLVSGFSGGGGGGASNGAVLPIELISFSGYAGKNTNILQWTTLSEVNMAMFYIERSISGKEWTLIGKMEAAGDSYIQQDYKFVDKEPLTKAFYRLRMIDKDGRYSMSKVISIERKDSGLKLNAVYPNPNDGNFVVNLTSMPNEDGKIILVNTLGVKVFTKELNAQGGRTIEKINVSHLPTGIYTLLLEQNDEIITKRVMIDR